MSELDEKNKFKTYRIKDLNLKQFNQFDDKSHISEAKKIKPIVRRKSLNRLHRLKYVLQHTEKKASSHLSFSNVDANVKFGNIHNSKFECEDELKVESVSQCEKDIPDPKIIQTREPIKETSESTGISRNVESRIIRHSQRIKQLPSQFSQDFLKSFTNKNSILKVGETSDLLSLRKRRIKDKEGKRNSRQIENFDLTSLSKSREKEKLLYFNKNIHFQTKDLRLKKRVRSLSLNSAELEQLFNIEYVDRKTKSLGDIYKYNVQAEISKMSPQILSGLAKFNSNSPKRLHSIRSHLIQQRINKLRKHLSQLGYVNYHKKLDNVAEVDDDFSATQIDTEAITDKNITVKAAEDDFKLEVQSTKVVVVNKEKFRKQYENNTDIKQHIDIALEKYQDVEAVMHQESDTEPTMTELILYPVDNIPSYVGYTGNVVVRDVAVKFNKNVNRISYLVKQDKLSITQTINLDNNVSERKKRIYSSLLPEITDDIISNSVDLLIVQKPMKSNKLPKKKIQNVKKDIKLSRISLPRLLMESENSVLEKINDILMTAGADDVVAGWSVEEEKTKEESDEKDEEQLKKMEERTDEKLSKLNTSFLDKCEFENLEKLIFSRDSTNTMQSTVDEDKLTRLEYKRPQSRIDLTMSREDMMNVQNCKQTILKYEAKIRQLISDRSAMQRETENSKAHNTALQKRHAILSTEFKQEKREIQFIKSQIAVMLSRIQTIPEKLNQLETENGNLKSEKNDLEKTLSQRDQLFASERQINASLSEEIVKLESDTVNKDLMKSVCDEFENLNEEYEILKHTLDETEDKLYELAEDRDNLLKHSKILEDHLLKMKTENNYLQMLVSNGVTMGNDFNRSVMGNMNESKECVPDDRNSNHQVHCHKSSHSSNRKSKRRKESDSPSCSSDCCTSETNSSTSSEDRHRHHKKKRKDHHRRHRSNDHKKHKREHSRHKHRRKHSEKFSKSEVNSNNLSKKTEKPEQNANNTSLEATTFKMPENRQELNQLEKTYDILQREKTRLEAALSHVPLNKGTSNATNMSNLQEQEMLEGDLDKCDKKLASLRKILKQCKVFKSIIP